MFDIQICYGSSWVMHDQGLCSLREVLESIACLKDVPDRVVIARRMASTMRAPVREFPRSEPYLTYADSIEYDGGYSASLLWLVDSGA